MAMFYLMSLVIFFLIISGIIWLLPPDRMAEEEKFRPKIREIEPIITLCQTALYGQPKIRLLPPKQEMTLNLDFSNPETVMLSLPLRVVRQELAKAQYLDVFAKHGLGVKEHRNGHNQEVLSVSLDRNDEALSFTIISLYKDLFEAKDYDAVNLYVRTLKSDSYALSALKNNIDINPDYKFKSQSQRYEGKSVRKILFSRILMAANILLFPVMIVLTYKSFGFTGMCWAALCFFALLAGARIIAGQKLFEKSRFQSLPFLGLLIATLVTGQTVWVKFIPSVAGGLLASYGVAQLLGVAKNQFSEFNDKQSHRILQIAVVVLGLGFLLMSEWARRTMNQDSWVWFFGFMRFEWMLLALMVMSPVFLLLDQMFKSENQLDTNQ